MQENRPQFKRPSKKHEPKGLTILYEDRDMLVVNKINGLLTMSTAREKENTAYFLLTDYVKKGNPRSKSRIFIVHRLDRETSGVLVFAKSEPAKRYLQDNWATFHKTYSAVVHGQLAEKEGILTSYLVENQLHRMYSINNPKRESFPKPGTGSSGNRTSLACWKSIFLPERRTRSGYNLRKRDIRWPAIKCTE